MCVQCMLGAMTAGATATGTRSWLAGRGFSWLTAARLRAITIVLLALAMAASTVTFSGSAGAPAKHKPAAIQRSAHH